METKILEIKTIENKIKKISSDIDFHYISLGNYIVLNETDEHHAFIKKNKLSSDIKSIKVIFDNFNAAMSKREIITHNKKRISEIDQKIKETLKNINDVEKENNKHYIGIAETLYDIYKKDTEKMAEFGPYFSEVIAIDNRNKEIITKIKDIENEKKSSFLSKIKDSGEKAILNTRKRYNYSLMLSYFKTAGEKMCADKVYETANNSDIEALFVPYKNSYKMGEEFSGEFEKLNAEKNNFRQEIDDIMQEFNFDPNSYIKTIKAEKDIAEKDLGKKIFEIINKPEKDDETVLPLKNSDSEIKRIAGGIELLNEEKEELDKKMEQINLAIEIEKTEKDIVKYKVAIEKKNQKVDEINEEIEEYINMINVSETQLDELRKKVVKQD